LFFLMLIYIDHKSCLNIDKLIYLSKCADLVNNVIMTLEKTNKLLAVQPLMGSSDNRNGVKLILTEVQREHEQTTVNRLVATLKLKRIFDFTVQESDSRI